MRNKLEKQRATSIEETIAELLQEQEPEMKASVLGKWILASVFLLQCFFTGASTPVELVDARLASLGAVVVCL